MHVLRFMCMVLFSLCDWGLINWRRERKWEERFRSLLSRNPQRETQEVSLLQISSHTPCSFDCCWWSHNCKILRVSRWPFASNQCCAADVVLRPVFAFGDSCFCRALVWWIWLFDNMCMFCVSPQRMTSGSSAESSKGGSSSCWLLWRWWADVEMLLWGRKPTLCHPIPSCTYLCRDFVMLHVMGLGTYGVREGKQEGGNVFSCSPPWAPV